tara:strand:- start:135 stop:500 length:366 start_codon:yes stop_codon:yes gene_type:complete
MTDKKKNPDLKAHFERLKELVPEVYSRKNDHQAEIEQLYKLLKNSLGIVEAIHLQDNRQLHNASIEEYGKIIYQLELMGYDYEGNDDLLSTAAAQILMKSKKPMQKAGKKSSGDQDNREAI